MASSRRNERSPLPVILAIVLVGGLVAIGWLLLSEGDGPQEGQGNVVSHNPQDQRPGGINSPAPDRPDNPIESLTQPISSVRPTNLVQEMFGDTGAISGRVVSGTEPVEGVEIALWKGNSSINAAWTALRKPVSGIVTVTDAQGHFLLEHVPAGKGYVVVGEHPEFAASERGNIRVNPQGVVKDVLVRMRAGAIIGGEITDELSGNPIVGARAELTNTLERAMNPDADERPWKVVFSDNQGRYAFAHVSAPNIKVKISAEGFETRSRSVNFALEGKARTREDIHFQLGAGHTLSGQVQDAGGTPIADAKVVVTALTKAFQGEALAFSDRAGYFLLEGLGEHNYQLRASARGFSNQQLPKVGYLEQNLLIVLLPRGQVAGRVANYGGSPVTNFQLHLMRAAAGREPIYQKDKRPYSSASGQFVFDDLDPGLYALEARSKGYAPARSDVFEIVRDANAPDITITLGQGGTLTGRISDMDGKPVEGARVALNENEHVENAIAKIFGSLTPTGGPRPLGVTDRKGQYHIENIPVGVYQLAVSHKAWASFEQNHVQIVDDSAGGNSPSNITMPRGAILGGRALDEANRPLTFSRVQLTDGAGFMENTTTDNTGRFRFENLREGSYKLTLSPDRDANGNALNPIIVLVYSQRSTQEVYLDAGQVLDDMTLYLRTKS